jgi:multiple sugar transport system substrate-binding protein
MKKRLVALCLAAAMVTTIFGCASDEPKETPDDTASGEKIELTCWIRASSAENNQSITIEEFNQSQDRIHVTTESYGDNYEEMLKLAANSGELPDFFDVAGLTSLSQYVDAGVVAPLDEFLTDEYKAEYNPSAFVKYSFDGKVYGIPSLTRFIRLYYNRDLFDKAGLDPDKGPETLEEMYEMAKKITEEGKGEFYGFGFPMKSSSTWERDVDLISILSGKTGPYAFDYTTGKFDFAKEKEIIEYFAKMYQEGFMMPGAESLDIEVIRANFIANKVGMYFDGNWMINGYNNEIEGGDVTNWDTAIVPIFEGEERAKDYLMLDSGYSIAANCEHKEEAFEALDYTIRNIVTAPARKNPDAITPSFSVIDSINKEVNSSEEVQGIKGIKGVAEGQSELSLFEVTPHSVLTLEGESRDDVYPLLIINSDMDIDAELEKLSATYNSALENAVAEGILSEEDLKPAGFDYYTR